MPFTRPDRACNPQPNYNKSPEAQIYFRESTAIVEIAEIVLRRFICPASFPMCQRQVNQLKAQQQILAAPAPKASFSIC